MPPRICMKAESTLTTLARTISSRCGAVTILEISYSPLSAISGERRRALATRAGPGEGVRSIGLIPGGSLTAGRSPGLGTWTL